MRTMFWLRILSYQGFLHTRQWGKAFLSLPTFHVAVREQSRVMLEGNRARVHTMSFHHGGQLIHKPQTFVQMNPAQPFNLICVCANVIGGSRSGPSSFVLINGFRVCHCRIFCPLWHWIDQFSKLSSSWLDTHKHAAPILCAGNEYLTAEAEKIQLAGRTEMTWGW